MNAGTNNKNQSGNADDNRWRWVFALLFATVLSYLQLRWWWQDHKASIDMLMTASEGVLTGTPHWRAYQNRLLGPALVHALGWFSALPFKTFAAIGFLSSNLILLKMLALQASKHGLRLGWWVVVPMILPSLIWKYGSFFLSYPWDFLEMHMLLVLCFIALSDLRNKSWPLIGLFAASLLSRESALFIPLFLLVRIWLDKEANLKRDLPLAVGLMLFGAFFIHETRNLLFKHSSLPGIGIDQEHLAMGNHWALLINWRYFNEFVQKGEHAMAFVLLFGLTGFFAWAAYALIKKQEKAAAAFAITMLAYMLAMIPFAHLKESRVYQPVGHSAALLGFFIWLKFRATVLSPRSQL